MLWSFRPANSPSEVGGLKRNIKVGWPSGLGTELQPLLGGFDPYSDLQYVWEYSSNGLEWWSPKPQVIGSSPIALANLYSQIKLLIMVRDYIIETLLKIKEYDEKIHKLYDMGVDLLEFNNTNSQLEKSIPTILRKKQDKQFGWIQDLVGWWLYDNVDKKIWHEEVEFNVESVENFTDYLIREYGSNDIPTN